MEKPLFPILISGHIAHGKRTLIGRILYDTGSLPPRIISEIRAASLTTGSLELAYVVDNLIARHAIENTVDASHISFETDTRRYVVIDTPGHKTFLKNLITGSKSAEVTVVIVDAAEGIHTHTKRHCSMLKLLGITQVIVAVNKMDTVDFLQERYEDVCREMMAYLLTLGIKPVEMIPISARTGENIVYRSNHMPWYDGKPFTELLDGLKPHSYEEGNLCFPVHEVHPADDGRLLAAGHVESGTIRTGDNVIVFPDSIKTKILAIQKSGKSGLKKAGYGDCVDVMLENPETLRPGSILTDSSYPIVTNSIEAVLYWTSAEPFQQNEKLQLRCATQETECTIDAVHTKYNPVSMGIIEQNSTTIETNEIAQITISATVPIVVQDYAVTPVLGRFTLEKDGKMTGGGIISL